MGPLVEQKVLLTPKPSLQDPKVDFYKPYSIKQVYYLHVYTNGTLAHSKLIRLFPESDLQIFRPHFKCQRKGTILPKNMKQTNKY